MTSTPEALAKRFLRAEWDHLSAAERRVVEAVLERRTLARDTHHAAGAPRPLGERMADRVARFGGSWTFILLFLGMMLFWATLNTEFLGPINRAFDPYPFVFLNLVLSMLAALQAPVIMMSQGRQANLDRRRAEADYEINLKSEIEIRQLHEKFDELRESRWAALTAQQERQIEMLTDLLRDRGTSGTNAPHTP